DLFSWLGDAGASISIGSDGTPSGGIVALAADASAGKVRVQQWLGLLKLAGAQAGGAISVTEAPYAGTTITTIHVDAGSVAGTALGGAPSAAPASGAEVEVAVAFKDGLLVIGASDAFVERVLDLSPADSLAQLASYREALGAAGGPSDTGVAWLAASQLRTALEPLIPASERAQYDSQVEPFLAPIDHLVAVNTNDGDTIVSHMELATR
ncbi:MAG TPA: hypothetical protein VFW86_06040, partial [Candidatus Limnocylindrales bacterium]|nr:hypothetical protein [Candidatus Limnocylindrales bacterium]